jgi:hypothetical protein
VPTEITQDFSGDLREAGSGGGSGVESSRAVTIANMSTCRTHRRRLNKSRTRRSGSAVTADVGVPHLGSPAWPSCSSRSAPASWRPSATRGAPRDGQRRHRSLHVCVDEGSFGAQPFLRLSRGDSRDAVLDAYTAFDMYLSIVPVRARYDRDVSLAPKDIARIRDELAPLTRLSERAIGAALACASLVSGAAPPAIPSRLQAIRNEAVHGGVYPSESDAEWLALKVEELICAFELLLDAASPSRDPPFHVAFQIASFIGTDGPPAGIQRVSTGRGFVLSRANDPQPKAIDRLSDYRADPRLQGSQVLLLD